MDRNEEDFQFSFVDKYFKENSLVDHHITSCDTFYDVSIPKIFKDKNPIRYYGIMDEKTKQYKYSARLYIGGKKADKIYYGNTRNDAKEIGFDDDFIYDEINKDLEDRKIPIVQVNREQAQISFRKWVEKEDKIKY
jgi:hypothetical protein